MKYVIDIDSSGYIIDKNGVVTSTVLNIAGYNFEEYIQEATKGNSEDIITLIKLGVTAAEIIDMKNKGGLL